MTGNNFFTCHLKTIRKMALMRATCRVSKFVAAFFSQSSVCHPVFVAIVAFSVLAACSVAEDQKNKANSPEGTPTAPGTTSLDSTGSGPSTPLNKSCKRELLC